jgi:hypothetical protein
MHFGQESSGQLYTRARVEDSNLQFGSLILGFDKLKLVIESLTNLQTLNSLRKCKVAIAQSEISKGKWF